MSFLANWVHLKDEINWKTYLNVHIYMTDNIFTIKQTNAMSPKLKQIPVEFLRCWKVITISNQLSIESAHRWLWEGSSGALHPSGLSEVPSRSARQQHIIKDGRYLFTHNSHYLELLNPPPSPLVCLWFKSASCSRHQYQLLLLKDVFREGRKISARHSFRLQPGSPSNLITVQ